MWTKGEPCKRYCLGCGKRMQYEGVNYGRHIWHCYDCIKTRGKKDKLNREYYDPMKDPKYRKVA